MTAGKVGVKIFMDAEHRKRIQDAAKRQGLSLSAFMRRSALAECEKQEALHDN